MAGPLIGALRVSLSAETSAFEAGMSKAQRTAQHTSKSIASSFEGLKTVFDRTAFRFVEALTLGALVAAGKSALEYAGHLGELADTLGLTTKDLQEFSYAAGQVGISQEELQVGIQKLTVSMGQAQAGSKKQITAFKELGLSVSDLQKMDAGDVFRVMAQRLPELANRSQRAAIEVALLGKAGAKLDNLFSGSQGSLNELSEAAAKLGIVLSDEQIRKADETADKIEALKTVLKAKIAGSVADDADAILSFANSLVQLVSILDKAGQAFLNFQSTIANNFSIPAIYNRLVKGEVYGYGVAGHSVTVPLPPATEAPKKGALGGTRNIGQFLAGSGPKAKKPKEDHSAEEAERRAYEFQRQEFDAQKDILEAKKDLATDYSEQTTLSVQILDLERKQYQASLDHEVAENRLTKGKQGLTQAQANQLMSAYDIADGLKREKLLQDEEEQRQRDVAMLEEHDLDRKKDLLQKQADLASTQAERRQIELDLLQLAYEEKKQALQRIIDTSKDQAAIEDARRDLVDLKSNYALDRQSTINQTRGPLEDYLAGIPRTAAQVNEALQTLEVQGIDGLANALSHVGEGWKAMREIALSTIQDIVAALIKMQLQRMFANLIGSAAGGGGSWGGVSAAGLNFGTSSLSSLSGGLASAPIPGFATGGAFNILGRSGSDRNILSLNGLPIAKVSHGERLSIGQGGKNGRQMPPFIFNNYAQMSPQQARETGMQAAAGWNSEIARSRSKGISR